MRVYPPQQPQKDEKYGIRVDRGEPVNGQPDVLRLKLQLNINAKSKTIRELGRQNPHQAYATVDLNVKQELTKENLKKMEDALVSQL